GISFALTEALDEGHCGLPRDELLPLAVELLEIPDTIVLDALRRELDAGQVIADQVEGRGVFLGGLYHAERSIADRLRTLSRGSMPWKSIDAQKAIPWVEARTSLALAASQKTAIDAALRWVCGGCARGSRSDFLYTKELVRGGQSLPVSAFSSQ
ncbi:MAG: hypothetical protein WCC90_19095, partial [Methylocella sp.]